MRARPLIGHEREAGACSITNKLSKSELVLGSDRVFSFNHVFGPEDEQELVFTQAVSLNGSLGVVSFFSKARDKDCKYYQKLLNVYMFFPPEWLSCHKYRFLEDLC